MSRRCGTGGAISCAAVAIETKQDSPKSNKTRNFIDNSCGQQATTFLRAHTTRLSHFRFISPTICCNPLARLAVKHSKQDSWQARSLSLFDLGCIHAPGAFFLPKSQAGFELGGLN